MQNNDARVFIWTGVALVAITGVIWAAYSNFIQSSPVKQTAEVQVVVTAKEKIKDKFEDSSNTEILNAIKNQFTIEIYQVKLNEQEQRIRDKFTNTDLVERIVLERELSSQQAIIENYRQHYTEKINLLFNAFLSLKSFRDKLPAQDYLQAQAALMQGDTSLAVNLFSTIESNYQNAKQRHEINHAAVAAFQRGRIAQDQTDYRKAYRYFRRAAQYNPENIEYLIAAGNVSNDIALYSNAILYYEAALYHQKNVQLKNKLQKETVTSVQRQLLINLGGAWNSKGDAEKAIEYYELALASDISLYGAGHTNVAMDKNFLGTAWESKDKFQTAIEYYSQALVIYKSESGVSDSMTLSVKENLERVLAAQKGLTTGVGKRQASH